MSTPATRRQLDATATGIMLILCLCWGFQQIAIKLAIADVPSVMQIATRSGVVALILGAYLISRKGLTQFRDGTALPGLLAGLLFAGEFLFVALALNQTLAAHVSIFLYTSPIFAALGLHIRLPEERLSALQWVGILIAFAGIAIAFLGGGSAAGASNMLLGDFLALLGGASWGVTTVVIRMTKLSEAPAAKTLFYQASVGAIILFAVALLTGAAWIKWTTTSVLSLSFQTFVVTLGTFLVWFWLMRRYLASRLSILSFLTPIFAVALSVVVLKEPITPGFAIGAVLVLCGIVLVSGADLISRKKTVAA